MTERRALRLAEVAEHSTRNEIELAWAAGFWDGEGCSTLKGGYIHAMVKQAADVGAAMPKVLTRFGAAVEIGRFGGPYSYRLMGARRPSFLWWASGAEAWIALQRLWPYLGEVKKEQALRCWEADQARRKRPA